MDGLHFGEYGPSLRGVRCSHLMYRCVILAHSEDFGYQGLEADDFKGTMREAALSFGMFIQGYD
jgi:hypothetical protein